MARLHFEALGPVGDLILVDSELGSDSGVDEVLQELPPEMIEQLKERLKENGKAPRVRADTLGYAQRCWPDPSPVDQREARDAGRLAATIAKAGDTDGSIAIKRVKTEPYEARLERVPLEAVAAKTRHMPGEFITRSGDNVTAEFIEWLRPLVGDMPRTGRL